MSKFVKIPEQQNEVNTSEKFHVGEVETPVYDAPFERAGEEGSRFAEKDTVYIDMDKLRPNKNNEYPLSDLEQLSGMIKMAGGILQNLIVMPADEEGFYTITTGERRWRAAKLLQERGEYPEKFQGRVPCLVMGIDEIDLPLDDERKEDFAILVTNQYRKKTDGVLFMEMQKWNEIIKQLRAAGVEYISAKDFSPQNQLEEDGVKSEGEQGIKIKGVPTREIVASQLNISTGQVSRLEKLEKKGSNKLLDMLIGNKMDLSMAEEMLSLDKDRQDEVIEQLEAESGEAEVLDKAAVKEKVQSKAERILINKKEIVSELEAVSDSLAETVKLTPAEYARVQKAIGQIKRILL